MSVQKLNQNNFNNAIANGTTLMDFYADWCGPCRMVSPIVDEIAEERSDITVGKVNVDDENALAMKYGVMSIPTLIVFQDEKEKTRIVGARPKAGACVMKRIIIAISVALMLIPLLIGCNGNNKSSYEQITPAEAKALMDSEDGYIILDVRTPEEFAERHIEGAILIPDYEIGEKAESILTDKDQLILVYCRSGRRSKNAANKLAASGYTNIKEFGGINDWKYGTVTE